MTGAKLHKNISRGLVHILLRSNTICPCQLAQNNLEDMRGSLQGARTVRTAVIQATNLRSTVFCSVYHVVDVCDPNWYRRYAIITQSPGN